MYFFLGGQGFPCGILLNRTSLPGHVRPQTPDQGKAGEGNRIQDLREETQVTCLFILSIFNFCH